jgi:hypothetical protein
MSGGLVVLGFLFLTFIFRSAIVGDLAPTANERGAPPTARMPPVEPPYVRVPASHDEFSAARQLARKAPRSLDAALETMGAQGLGEPRILQATAESTRIRVYARGHGGCDAMRGYLVGAFEGLVGAPVKADEVACRRTGEPDCEFLLRHPARSVEP